VLIICDEKSVPASPAQIAADPDHQGGVFKITSQIGLHPITVTGRMMNGVPRLSNIWVPR